MPSISSRHHVPGIARSHVAARVEAERARGLDIGGLASPVLVVIALLVLPVDISWAERLVASGMITGSVVAGMVAMSQVSTEWAMAANSTMKVLGAVAVAIAIPELFVAALVFITASTIATAAVQPRPDSVFLAGGAALTLGISALITGEHLWFLPLAVLVVITVATRAWSKEWRLQQAETDLRFDDLIDSSRTFFWEADPATGELVSIAGNTDEIVGYSPEELLDLGWRQMVIPEEHDRVAARLTEDVPAGHRDETTVMFRHRDGRSLTLRQLIRVGHNGNLMGAATDMTAQYAISEALRHQAEHDMLTDLPNRLMFQNELDLLLHSEKQDQVVGLLLMDLDGFKEINDTLGHNIGDRVLQRLADRFRNSLGHVQLSARIGGDEFAILVVGEAGELDAAKMQRFAGELMALLDQPIQIGDLRLAIRASAGIVMAPEHGENGDLLLQRADIAMYQAKASVESFAVYSPVPDAHSVERLQLSARIGDALANEEFELWFQPKVDLTTGELIGVEGLARWRHPDLGILTPDRFLALLSVAGEYQTFTNQMIEKGISFLGATQRAGTKLSVAINLGSVSFLDCKLPGQIKAMLDMHGSDPDSLILEVTEEEILLDRDTSIDVFAQLERIGLRLSIDDFGTGYSSLARLRSLRIDELKIDQSFVARLNVDPDERAIVRTIIELAKQLNQHTVAEGIETTDQLASLQSLGCDSGQGYLFDKPLPPGEFWARLDNGGFRYADKFRFGVGAGQATSA